MGKYLRHGTGRGPALRVQTRRHMQLRFAGKADIMSSPHSEITIPFCPLFTNTHSKYKLINLSTIGKAPSHRSADRLRRRRNHRRNRIMTRSIDAKPWMTFLGNPSRHFMRKACTYVSGYQSDFLGLPISCNI